MNYPTPAAESAAGELLWVEHPIGGNRPMAHVFMLADEGGIAWADHGWTDGLSGRHPFHRVLGPLQPAGEGRWHLTPTEEHLVEESGGQPILIRRPLSGDEAGNPDGDRGRARELVLQTLAMDDLNMAPDL